MVSGGGEICATVEIKELQHPPYPAHLTWQTVMTDGADLGITNAKISANPASFRPGVVSFCRDGRTGAGRIDYGA